MRNFIFYLSILIFTWVYSVFYYAADWDFWARLTVGKTFLQTGTVMHHDFLSYTTQKALWIDHEWGSGVIFYFFSEFFGDTGLFLLKIFINFTIVFLLTRIVKLNSDKPNSHLNIVFYYLAFLGIFQGVAGTVRCQLFTFLFFTLWIYVLERIRRGENRLFWILPATMIIWANVHGGFISGIGLLAMYGIGEFLNKKPFAKYFIAIMPCSLVTLINPYGINYLYYIFDAITMPRPTINEWQHSFLDPNFFKWFSYKLLLFISIITVFINVLIKKYNFKKADKVKWAVLLVTLYLSLKHVKHQAFFGIAAGAFLYQDFYAIFSAINAYLKSKLNFYNEKFLFNAEKIKNILLYSFIILIGSLVILSKPLNITVPEQKYPVKSIEFIKINNIEGNLITVFQWGSYAAWKLYPQCLVGMDGRYEEVYPDEVYFLTDNFIWQRTNNWYKFLDVFHTDIIVVNKKHKSYKGLKNTKKWKEVYTDKISSVFVPVYKAKKNYKQPNDSQGYYNDNKYKSGINFL